MATLEESQTKRSVSLPTRAMVGRDPACELTIDGGRVSREHARIQWQSGGWRLRDLGSRNGTWLNGRRLDSGEDATITVQDRIRFGDEGPEWVLVDRGAPPISAVNLLTHQRVTGNATELCLPDGAKIEAEPPGRYALVLGPVRIEAYDGQSLQIGDTPWRLELPGGSPPTIGDPKGTPIEEIGLVFSVSKDEERVSISVRHNGRSHPVPERTFHYVLLTLARARLQDRSEGHSDGECGWRDRQELYKDLATDRESFNKAVSRIRKQFETLGINDARDLVEVWGESRRIGVSRLEVI